MSVSPEPAPGGAPRRRVADRGGFTLVEVLVAFVVMATLLSVLFRGVVVMRAGSGAFDTRTRQEIVAEAVLEDALAKRELGTGRYSGLRQGSRWTLVATPVDLSAQMSPPPSPRRDKPATSQPDPGGQTPGRPDNPDKKDKKTTWVPQRLIVRIETQGRPIEVETIRLVKAE